MRMRTSGGRRPSPLSLSRPRGQASVLLLAMALTPSRTFLAVLAHAISKTSEIALASDRTPAEPLDSWYRVPKDPEKVGWLEGDAFAEPYHRRAAGNRPLSERQKSANTTRSARKLSVLDKLTEGIYFQRALDLRGRAEVRARLSHGLQESPLEEKHGDYQLCLPTMLRVKRRLVKFGPRRVERCWLEGSTSAMPGFLLMAAPSKPVRSSAVLLSIPRCCQRTFQNVTSRTRNGNLQVPRATRCISLQVCMQAAESHSSRKRSIILDAALGHEHNLCE
jgi:hypothetical protein